VFGSGGLAGDEISVAGELKEPLEARIGMEGGRRISETRRWPGCSRPCLPRKAQRIVSQSVLTQRLVLRRGMGIGVLKSLPSRGWGRIDGEVAGDSGRETAMAGAGGLEEGNSSVESMSCDRRGERPRGVKLALIKDLLLW